MDERGTRRALVWSGGVAHGRPFVAYESPGHGAAFADPGVGPVERRDADRLRRRPIAGLGRLGCKVTVEAAAA